MPHPQNAGPRAEVIAIGDELTSGQRLDTNSQWISQRLGECGVDVLYHTTVGDDLAALQDVLRHAWQRAEIVVTTGGLGPTADDLTRQAIAAATERPLSLNAQALRQITDLFARRGRNMPPQNQVQAMFPLGAQLIPNPHGTAPGIALQQPRADRPPAHLFALPGVPAEMHEMWFQSVLPAIQQATGQQSRVILHRRIKCFGVGESDLEAMLPDLIQRGRVPTVGITVHRATITLRITAAAADRQACLEQMEPTVQTIHQCLGDLVFGQEDDELQHAVARLLIAQQQSCAVAEWGTAGTITRWLAELPEAAQFMRGGMTATSPQALASGLKLPPSLAVAQPSAEQALAMAQHVRQQLQADYGLAITPFPPECDAGQTYFIALATAEQTEVIAKPLTGHPDILVERAAKQALNQLRLVLSKIRPK